MRCSFHKDLSFCMLTDHSVCLPTQWFCVVPLWKFVFATPPALNSAAQIQTVVRSPALSGLTALMKRILREGTSCIFLRSVPQGVPNQSNEPEVHRRVFVQRKTPTSSSVSRVAIKKIYVCPPGPRNCFNSHFARGR